MSIPGAASPLFLTSAAADAAAYQINRSLRFNDNDGAKLTKTFSSAGNQKKWTWSAWVKRSSGGSKHHLFAIHTGNSNSGYFRLAFNSDNTLFVGLWSKSILTSDAVFVDFSAWMHIVLTLDTANSTAADRIILYVNGVRQSVSGSADNDTAYAINSAGLHNIGSQTSTSQHFDGYMTEVTFCDGQALSASDFGEYDSNNVWRPKAFSGTYGSNGFKLDFSDNTSTTTIAEDSSGNNFDWTANNISVSSGSGNDSLIDTPTNYTADSGNNGGCYCTLNPRKSRLTITNGNLDSTSPGDWKGAAGTLGMSSGKFYWEIDNVQSNEHVVGICKYNIKIVDWNTTYGYGAEVGVFYPAAGGQTYGAAWTTGDVIGVAFDADNGILEFYKNGTSQGVAQTGLTDGPYLPSMVHNGSSRSASINFGQRPWTYTPKSGHVALCTQNLTTPTIADPSTAFDAKTYTGNGGTQSISLGFSPDFLWFKARGDSGQHALYDVVRGASKSLVSNGTNAEGTEGGGLSTFDSSGFSLSGDNTVQGSCNGTSRSYVAWGWDAGTSTASNTDGNITSNVRANTSAGVSIVTYTGNGSIGQTIGHGLSAAPYMIWAKNRDRTDRWGVYHKAVGGGNTLVLNTNGAPTGGTGIWGNTDPTNSVFTVSNDPEANRSGEDYVAYCFAPVEGFSAIGEYTGTNSTDDNSPFIYCGFRPRWIMIKAKSSVTYGNWIIHDTARSTYNRSNKNLYANLNNEEDTSYSIDILSNGFKIMSTNFDGHNGNDKVYTFIAFAEHPIQANGGLAR